MVEKSVMEGINMRRAVWNRFAGLAVLTMLAAGVGSATTAWFDASQFNTGRQAQSGAAPTSAASAATGAVTTSYTLGPKVVQVNISDAIVQAVKKATPSVVGVLNMQDLPNSYGTGYSLQEAGVGSGVIFSPEGYIVTNNHVVQGANQVQVDPRDKRTEREYFEVVGNEDGVFGCIGLMACDDNCPVGVPLRDQLAYVRRKMASAGWRYQKV